MIDGASVDFDSRPLLEQLNFKIIGSKGHFYIATPPDLFKLIYHADLILGIYDTPLGEFLRSHNEADEPYLSAFSRADNPTISLIISRYKPKR